MVYREQCSCVSFSLGGGLPGQLQGPGTIELHAAGMEGINGISLHFSRLATRHNVLDLSPM